MGCYYDLPGYELERKKLEMILTELVSQQVLQLLLPSH